ncbi:MAG TPA: hypothetical protein VG204_04490 [Terriglobia bacterium]|nr:hypothetical protein [Terriglobia bacterium]
MWAKRRSPSRSPVTVDDDLVSYALAIVVEPARAALYPILETLALVEPINVASDTVDTFFERLAAQDGGFNVIFTSAPRTSIPAALGHCSHITFIDSLS